MTRVAPAFVRRGTRKDAATRSRPTPIIPASRVVNSADRGKTAMHATAAAAQKLARPTAWTK